MTWLGRYKNPGAPVNGSRAIGTQYTPSTTAYVMHFITIQIVNASAQSATVQLLADSASPPTTVCAIATSNVVGTQDFQLCWITAPGDNVKLVATGTGAATIAAQFERPLGAPTE